MALTLVMLSGTASAEEGDARFGAAEGQVQGLIEAVEALRAGPKAEREARVERLIARHVDLEAWIGDAVPRLHALRATERAVLIERTRRLLVVRAARHLDVEGAARITLEKSRRDGREVAVDCLIHTDDATYEISLRWSAGEQPRLRDVRVEGVSVGASDRRRIRRAWDDGQLPAALAALDRAIGVTPSGAFTAPPAVATRTTSPDRPDAADAPPPSARPPGL